MPPKNEQTERQCLVTRETLPKAEMIRFVLAPDGTVVPDLKMRLPGRGVWVTADFELIQQAAQKGLFARGFKEKTQNCDNLAELVAKQLEKSCLSALSMTKKAGQIVTGFAKVEAAIAQNPIMGLIHAADAAEDGQKKLAQAMRRVYGREYEIPVIRMFSADELSIALGLGNVVHAALLAGSASKSFVKQATILSRFRGQSKDSMTDDPAEPTSAQAS